QQSADKEYGNSDTPYFTLNIAFAEYVSTTPTISLAGKQIFQDQEVTFNNQTVKFDKDDQVSTGQIEWTATITPNNCDTIGMGVQMPLNGQIYTKDSLTYDDESVPNTITDTSDTSNVQINFANALASYLKPGAQSFTIKFRTKPSASAFTKTTYTSPVPSTPGDGAIKGQRADLTGYASGVGLPSEPIDVDFKQTWLRKKGIYDAANNQIYWMLIFNENARKVDKAILTDKLDANQSLSKKSVFVSTKNSVSKNDEDASNGTSVWNLDQPTPSGTDNSFTIDLKKALNPASGKVLYICYITDVKESFFKTILTEEQAKTTPVVNDASVDFTMGETTPTWEGSFGPGPQKVIPGIASARKVGTYNPADHTVTWDIYVNEAHRQWTNVDVTDSIASNEPYGQYLLGRNGSEITPDSDLGTISNAIQVYDGGKSGNYSTTPDADATTKCSCTETESGTTPTYTYSIDVKWATPGTSPANEPNKDIHDHIDQHPEYKNDDTDKPIKSITTRKRITFKMKIVSEIKGNAADEKPDANTAHLIVNPKTRKVVTQEHKDAETNPETGAVIAPAIPEVSRIENWDTSTDAAQFDNDVIGSAEIKSTMLTSQFTEPTPGSMFDYQNKQLQVELVVNQNKQTDMANYYVVDTLPKYFSYVPHTLSCKDDTGSSVAGIADPVITPKSGDTPETAKCIIGTAANGKTLTLTFKIAIDAASLASLTIKDNKVQRNFTSENQAKLYKSDGSTIASATVKDKDDPSKTGWPSVTIDTPILTKKAEQQDNTNNWVKYSVLINKAGTDLSSLRTSDSNIKVIDTLPEGMQLVPGSVRLETVNVSPDGKRTEADVSENHSTLSDYSYTVTAAKTSDGTPAQGNLNVNLPGNFKTKPCLLTYQVEVSTLITGKSYQNLIDIVPKGDQSGSTASVTWSSISKSEALANSNRGVVEIQKIDKDTGVPLKNASFAAYCKDMLGLSDKDNYMFSDVLTDNNGLAVFRLPVGHTYTIKEIDTPTGYGKDADGAFTKGVDIHLTNDSGGVVYQWNGEKFYTAQGATPDTQSKPVAVTNKRSNDSSIVFYAQSNPSTSGNSSSSSSSQSSSSQSSSSQSSSSQSSSQSSSSQSSSSAISSKAGANFTGLVPLHGAGAINTDLPGSPLQGAVYGLYSNDAADVPVKDASGKEMTATSDSNGKLEFDKLAWGEDIPYYIREITPPKLFQSKHDYIYKAVLHDENDVTFSSIGKKQDFVGTSENKLIINYEPEVGTATVAVTKLGEDTGTVGLAGAVFQLEIPKSSTVFQTATSVGGTGIAEFKRLPDGAYTLHEKTPPSGYSLVGDQDITVKGGDITKVTVTDKKDPKSASGKMTMQMKYDKVTDEQKSKEYGFTIQLMNMDGTPLTGSFTYTRSDGRTDTLNFGTSSTSSASSSSSSSPTASGTHQSIALHGATSSSASSNTAIIPMKGDTSAALDIPNGTHYIISGPAIQGYSMHATGNDGYASASNTTPASFDYTKQSSDSSNASKPSSSGNTSNASGASKSSNGANGKNGSGTNGASGKNNVNGKTGTNGNGTNGVNGKGTNGTGTNGKSSSSLPKTNVPDTMPFWSIGLASSVVATVLVIRWGVRKRKKEQEEEE
ncbi:MAG: hypothetical protein LKF71_08350, partial [Oscillospiraceae bacterium]|nr:hypothetical protein [Oscillospiraceae bacterium]